MALLLLLLLLLMLMLMLMLMLLHASECIREPSCAPEPLKR